MDYNSIKLILSLIMTISLASAIYFNLRWMFMGLKMPNLQKQIQNRERERAESRQSRGKKRKKNSRKNAQKKAEYPEEVKETEEHKNKRKKRYIIITIASMVVFGISFTLYYKLSVKQFGGQESSDQTSLENSVLGSIKAFIVSSDSIKNGKWVKSIGAKNGNKSPELHWEEVDGANYYYIVMIDYNGNNWLHWTDYTRNNNVKYGEFSGAEEGYVGPYPPSGTHDYYVYIFALKDKVDDLKVDLDKENASINDISQQLNSGGSAGGNNVLALGCIIGSYSAE